LLAAVTVTLIGGAVPVAPAAAVEERLDGACDQPPSAIYVPACGAWQGVAPDVQKLAEFESTIGQRVQIYHEFLTFQSHDSPAKPFPKPAARAAIDGGRMYLFNLKPRNAAGTIYPWAQVAAGGHDGELHALMANIAQWAATAVARRCSWRSTMNPRTITARTGPPRTTLRPTGTWSTWPPPTVCAAASSSSGS